WLQFMIWSSLIGTAGAILGVVVALWMYSPKKKYKLAGQPTGVPYRGQKRWHWIFGMIFGTATVTWTFSGLMTLGPFPVMQRITRTAPQREQDNSAAANRAAAADVGASARGRGGRGGPQQDIAGALRG